MKLFLAATFALFLDFSPSVFAESVSPDSAFIGAAATKSHYLVIFHLDSESDAVMKKTLNNIGNVLEDPRLNGKIEVELIANSRGYLLYKKGSPYEGDRV